MPRMSWAETQTSIPGTVLGIILPVLGVVPTVLGLILPGHVRRCEQAGQ